VAVTLGGFVLLYTVLGVIDVVLMFRAERADRHRTGVLTMNEPVAGLNTAWSALIGLLWTGYLVLDGFDFGVGVLSLAIGRTTWTGGWPATPSARSGTATRSSPSQNAGIPQMSGS
jgi:hypothetical protein